MASQKNSPASKLPRIPPSARGIQVNFCKNPLCANYGKPPLAHSTRGVARNGKGDGYRRVSAGQPGTPLVRCNLCGEIFPLKSNAAITEEFDRLTSYLVVKEPCCPDEACSNHTVPISTPKQYQSFGKTSVGSLRYRCKSCNRLFSVAQKAGLRQRQHTKNRSIFSLLMNKSPMRRICEVEDINAVTLYQRIGFFHEQCLAFVANRERRLLDGSLHIRRLYLAVDRQDYVINWSNQSDRRNVTLHAVGSADEDTGYVFGMHLDFDPNLDNQAVEMDASAIADHDLPYAYRKYARLWLKADYTDALRQHWHKLKVQKRKRQQAQTGATLVDSIQSAYVDSETRSDVEQAATMDFDTQLPQRGMQVHSEYTLYGHFYFLERMLRGVEKVRFFMDQESGVRAAS